MNYHTIEIALKFSSNAERDEFEKQIDRNPMDSNTHMVYADWLEENGEHREAQFRRAMGKWFQENDFLDERNQGNSQTHYHAKDYNTWRIDRTKLPNGVNINKISVLPYDVERPVNMDETDPSEYGGTKRLGWRGYRNMEQGFRKAFEPNED